jgi:peptidoglycan/LPS O-acetylase OafA/YrhL
MPSHTPFASGSVHPSYRADIDGLRALAVLSVIGFHAFPNVIRSGFIGVDIFFVISGFLISTIIFESLARDQFSFYDFYSRRVRRIFPALAIVLGACLVFGWFALLTDEYAQLGLHTAGGAGFASNWLLWHESGYFDNASEAKPLLHLWSLAIEEQFYIVWPLLLWVAWKYKFNWLVLCAGVAVISFALNIYGIQDDKVAVFYSLQTRAWELLIGALVAYFINQSSSGWLANNLASVRVRDALAMSGALLLVIGMSLISKNDLFPGYYALLPTFGTALIILSGPKNWLSRHVLGHKFLVQIGLISFPLYLWHWPLLSFARIIESATPERYIRVLAVVVSFALAWLTYRIIERPIRSNTLGLFTAPLLLLLMLALGMSGYVIYKKEGLPKRSHAALTHYEGDTGHGEFHKYVNARFFPCSDKLIAEGSLVWEGLVQCAQSKPDARVDVALVGDSHDEHLFIGLAEGFADKNVAFYIRNSVPSLNNPEYSAIFQRVLADNSIKQVILTMWWIGRLTTTTESEILKVTKLLLDGGKEVFITDDVPNFPFDPQKCKGKRWLSTTDPTCTISQEIMTQQPHNTMLKNVIRQEPRLQFIPTQQYLCDGKDCSMARDDKLLYRDFNHLNIFGSKFVGNRLANEIYKP